MNYGRTGRRRTLRQEQDVHSRYHMCTVMYIRARNVCDPVTGRTGRTTDGTDGYGTDGTDGRSRTERGGASGFMGVETIFAPSK